MIQSRSEAEVFNELEQLCSSSGYIHAISFFCFRDNVYWYDGNLTAEDIEKLHSPNRLIRTEISTLIGLMLKKDIDVTLPNPDTLTEYISKTEELLHELHQSITLPARDIFMDILKHNKKDNPFTKGVILRESIFYGGDSAYDFQYLDLSVKKYQHDEKWFKENKGFSIYEVKVIIDAITELQHEKLFAFQDNLLKQSPDEWTYLELFNFSVDDIVNTTKLTKNIILNVLNAFSIATEKNENFKTLGDFNIINSKPLICLDDNNYLLLQHYSFLEAFYETPYYWFIEDKSYLNTAMKHRGNFTEEFSLEVLTKVFGPENVFSNINIYDNKKRIGEIDVLVVFANRAIILQAKSKKLTLEARKGNDNALSKDFKNAIHDSYEQGKDCATFIQDKKYKLLDANENEISIRNDFKEVYIFCVISDHYPSLAFQVDQFLEYEQSDIVKPPFVMDIFLLDVMTEMLSNPLHFLSYVNKRTTYFKKISAQHELVTLSYHLQKNLFLTDEFTIMMLDDSISSSLDQAILVRRKGMKGIATPEGILTKFKGTIIGNFIDSINSLEDDNIIEIGFFLLTLSEESIKQINTGIQKTIDLFHIDGNTHDFSVAFNDISTGLTIHCNDLPYEKAYEKLLDHCKHRKYREQYNNWFGLCIDPFSKRIKFGILSNKEWVYSKDIGNKIVQRLVSNNIKIGRNEKCPCGSGKKYKKCCLLK